MASESAAEERAGADRARARADPAAAAGLADLGSVPGPDGARR